MSNKENPAATRADWNIQEMPESNTTFILERKFSEEQIAALRHGNIPQEMEDKWFWFMEGDTLYAHRSWTGLCIYRIDFDFADSRHKVTMNADPSQVGIRSAEEGRRDLNELLNWWTQTQYDGYSEWINEVYNRLNQAGAFRKDKGDKKG